MKEVYKAINAVQRDLCSVGISKDSTNSFDNYKFRGIDAVYNALSPLLAKHGLCILPRMIARVCEERQSQKGGALFYVTVEAEFDLVAQDGSMHTVKTFGEAMDRGDKATNKAMSAAYKYAAFQTFAIPTEGDNDADASSHEVASKPINHKSVPASAFDAMPPEEQQFLRELAANVLAMPTPADQVAMIEASNLDADEKAALWSLFDSKQRAAMKAASKGGK